MRLSPFEIQTIKEQTARIFGPQSKVYLFGSRTDNNRKGGDIDLLVIPKENTKNNPPEINSLMTALILTLGDQKIDIIIKQHGDVRGIVATALQTGVEL